MSRSRNRKDGKKRVSNVWGAGMQNLAVQCKLHQFLSKRPPRRLPNDMQGDLCARRAQDESGDSVDFYLPIELRSRNIFKYNGDGIRPTYSSQREHTKISSATKAKRGIRMLGTNGLELGVETNLRGQWPRFRRQHSESRERILQKRTQNDFQEKCSSNRQYCLVTTNTVQKTL